VSEWVPSNSKTSGRTVSSCRYLQGGMSREPILDCTSSLESLMPAGEHGNKINRLGICHSSRKSQIMAPAGSTCRAECYRLWIRDPTLKLKHRDERQDQLFTSYDSFAGNVFLRHCHENRQHLDADNRQQLVNRSAWRVVGAALLPIVEHRPIDRFWPSLGSLGARKSFCFRLFSI
jgi:hypothetical protein